MQAGAAPAVLVAAADVRVAAPESELEGVLGDGAAALTVADHDVIAELVDAASVAEEFTYTWRTDAQRTVQVAGGRFSNTYGYGRDLGAAIRALLERQRLEPQGDRSAGAVLARRARRGRPGEVARLRPEDAAGRVAAAARSAAPARPSRCCCSPAPSTAPQPGQRILVGGYGEGADALLFRATDLLPSRRAATPVAALAGGAGRRWPRTTSTSSSAASSRSRRSPTW